jgi:hypothetical protein
MDECAVCITRMQCVVNETHFSCVSLVLVFNFFWVNGDPGRRVMGCWVWEEMRILPSPFVLDI